ncbi:MAP3K12-binding inhibitory protein 1-like [Acanthaster planci]|uniref:MAP3K12-binding inhibitory protein 1-like n=1 Tax=Acanthaster planci TaxID=133434 RepID=A0A8B7YBT0_ACAPL|nr:MAP3K12-binding inhibitory protein 1-like [Acanthaster planci]
MDLDDNVRSILTCLQNFLSDTNLSCSVSLTVDPSAICSINAQQLNTHLKKLVTSLQTLVHDHMTEDEDEAIPGPMESTASHIKDEDQKPTVPSDLSMVQISASNAEIERRIRAFMEKKQMEVDDINRREFYTVPIVSRHNQHHVNSCARTDAVFRPRAGCKSHVKVSRVVNVHGPQTRPTMVSYRPMSGRSPVSKARRCLSRLSSQQGIEERLHNMESHLKIRTGEVPRSDVYQRLKELESRILHLEGLSPEYFDAATQSLLKQQQSESLGSDSSDLSIHEIDSRIKQLQESLRRKSSQASHLQSNSGAPASQKT